MNGNVVGTKCLCFDSLEDKWSECGRTRTPTCCLWENSFNFVKSAPCRAKGINSVVSKTRSMNIMSLIDDDPYYSLLEVIVAEKICESRVMTFTRLKQLLDSNNEMSSQPRFFDFQIVYIFLFRY
jgi:hypothetical protein